MVFPNLHRSFLFVFFCAFFIQGCSGPQSNENRALSPPTQQKSGIPFSTKEPDVYQGDFTAGNGSYENKWFVARKGDNWRIDFFRTGAREWSQIKTDKVYAVDHMRKVYSSDPGGSSSSVDTSYFTTLLSGFFKGNENRQFEDLGREGNLTKYKVRTEGQTPDETFIYVDAATGMVVRQEFIDRSSENSKGAGTTFVYEIKNFTQTVDDSVFQMPDGYRMVTWDEYSSSSTQK